MTPLMPLIAALGLVIAAPEADSDTVLSVSLEWEESAPISSLWWGLHSESAERVSRQPSSAMISTAIRSRVQMRASRRFYGLNGSPDPNAWAVSERVHIETENFSAGFQADKDALEPLLLDTWRGWARYKGNGWTLVAGDHHLRVGEGVVFWTKPDFLSGWDVAGRFQFGGNGLSPASDAAVNAALRGAALQWEGARLRIGLTAAQTGLEAALDDSLRPSRLSYSGLHRTDAESRKRNAVIERLTGGFAQADLLQGKTALTAGVSGYRSWLSPPLSPEFDRRDRFAFEGGESGLGGAFFILKGQEDEWRGEAGIDDRGSRAASLRWLHRQKPTGLNWRAAWFSYPSRWRNHHSRSAWGGSEDAGLTGTALLIEGFPAARAPERWTAHIEISSSDWRRYNLTMPLVRAKMSLLSQWRLGGKAALTVRWRRMESMEGAAAESPVQRFSEDKLKASVSEVPLATGMDLGCFTEFGLRRNRAGQSWEGGVAGGRLRWQASAFAGALPLNIQLSIAGFSAGVAMPMYLGEADLPDRIASVRLSGRGLRVSAGIQSRRTGGGWLGVRLARSYRFQGADGSWELGVSFCFSSAGGLR